MLLLLSFLALLGPHQVVHAALSDDADMLYAARDGDVDKVIDFVKNKRVSLSTKNNHGVR